MFKPANKIRLRNIFNFYQWSFIFIAFFGVLGYIGLVAIWDILAALMKPDAYIVSTSMAISLIYLLFKLRKEFIKISNYGATKFNRIYSGYW
jgi:hypothetical protein